MTQDEIIKMADASGLSYYGMSKDRDRFLHHVETFADLVALAEREAFAKVVAAMHLYVDRQHAATLKMIERSAEKEREACAKVCEAQGEYYWQQYADAIRARGEQA